MQVAASLGNLQPYLDLDRHESIEHHLDSSLVFECEAWLSLGGFILEDLITRYVGWLPLSPK